MQTQSGNRIKPQHLSRQAVVYMRQSSDKQVRNDLENQRLQRELQVLARELGWHNVEVLDVALPTRAAVASGAQCDSLGLRPSRTGTVWLASCSMPR